MGAVGAEVSATSRWDPLGSRGLAKGAMWEPWVENWPLEKGHRPRQCGWRRRRADLIPQNQGELRASFQELNARIPPR